MQMMKKYTSLVRKYRDQSAEGVFSHFSFRDDLGEDWQSPYERLANLAKPEPWRCQDGDEDAYFAYPILRTYLNLVFLRLQDENKFGWHEDGSKLCFNTGLQTIHEEDIYALFFQQKLHFDSPDWVLYGFFTKDSNRMNHYSAAPPAAFAENPADLVFDPLLPIECSSKALVTENLERLPEILHDKPMLAETAIEGAIQQAKLRATRDYLFVLPGWYVDRVQMLMPLCLLKPHIVDAVLTLDVDRQQGCYHAKHLLTPQTAYINTRLIRPQNAGWLRV